MGGQAAAGQRGIHLTDVQEGNMKPVHHLITISVPPLGCIHGYLVCTGNKKELMKMCERVSDRMFAEIEKMKFSALPIVLMTLLEPDGIEIIESFLKASNENCAKTLNAYTDFHTSVWFMGEDIPGFDSIMELH
jgi:hypothetical protein